MMGAKAMNKKYDRTDRERDQSRRLEQGEAERQKARQATASRTAASISQSDEPRRQQGGWVTEESRGGPASGSESDGRFWATK